jgi:hypothetical protein
MTVPTKLQVAPVEIGILSISPAKIVISYSKAILGIT